VFGLLDIFLCVFEETFDYLLGLDLFSSDFRESILLRSFERSAVEIVKSLGCESSFYS
jgi:hypothetical protein